MTEHEWLKSESPHDFLKHLQPWRRHRRKLHLFLCAWCRYCWNRFGDRCQRLISITEQFAEGQVSRSKYEASKKAVARQVSPNLHDPDETDEQCNSRWLLTCLRLEFLPGWGGDRSPETRRMTAEELEDVKKRRFAVLKTDDSEKRSAIYQRFMVESLRCLFGNPFQSQKIEPSWMKLNGGAALRIARKIQSEHRFEDMKKLGRTLNEGGCTNSEVLDHCLQSVLHVPGCWVIDMLLGNDP
jgi:hypothetical protein